jgi:peptidyl-prolyl cis-trans isomerase D
VDGVDDTGHDAAGSAPELPQPSANVLRTAFDTAVGQMSQLSELGDDGYYIVQVDKVTPSAVKPLDEVKEQATLLWENERRNERLQKIAEEIAAEVNGGKDIKDVAPSYGVGVKTTPPLQRTGSTPLVPPALVAKLFEAKPGQAVATTAPGESYAVGQLREIQPADPEKDKDAVAQLSRELGTTMGNDTFTEYEQALRRRYPVDINQSKLDQLL